MDENNTLSRALYILDDENNPTSSRSSNIWPSTILDQVYDQLSPTKKTLREILDDLHLEIISGGVGNIVFPVTSVNGMEGDVNITKDHLGLDKVDNTSDDEKPLSDPQRQAVMNIVEHYEFQPDLSDLYDHILNSNNPHGVTLQQLDQDDEVKHFVINLIETHNIKDDAHADIRNVLGVLGNNFTRLDTDLNSRVDMAMDALDTHVYSNAAHNTLFETKEDKANKASTFNTVDHVKFPTVRAVVDYLTTRLEEFRDIINADQTSILDLIVVDDREHLPAASDQVVRKIYFIRSGLDGCSELAVCRLVNNTYSWDINSIDILPKLNQYQFQRDPDGISINVGNLSQNIIADSNISSYLIENVQDHLPEIMGDYYTKSEMDDMGFIHGISIIPGTSDGSIRYFTNGNRDTMSADIHVAGLHSLAFLDTVTANHIENEAIEGRHIKSREIVGSHLADKAVETRCLTSARETVLGNMDDDTGRVEEVPIARLAEILYPYIVALADENDLIGTLSDP